MSNPQTTAATPAKPAAAGPKPLTDFEKLLLNDIKTQVTFTPYGSDDEIKLSVPLIRTYIAVPAVVEKGGVKEEVFPDDRECVRFLMLCRSRRLNPFEGDAFMVPFFDKRLGRHAWSLITAHTAFLKRAELHPEYDGMDSGVIVRDEDGEIQQREGDFTHEKDTLLGGWATVYFKKRGHPKKSKVKLSTYIQPFGVWIKDPAGMICKCFDSKTQILTSRGFEPFATAEGKILEVADGGLRPTEAVPFVQNYSGPMVTYQSDDINFCVTPNHDMATVQGKISAGDMFEQSRMRPKFWIPRIVRNSFPDFHISDRQIKLAAAFIADGSATSNVSFAISVSRLRKIGMLESIGGESRRITRHCAGDSAVSHGRQITTLSDKDCFSYRLSDIAPIVNRQKVCNMETVLALSERQARLFVDSLIFFDGHIAESGTPRFYSSRPEVVRAFEVAAVSAGYAVAPRKMRDSDISTKLNAMIGISARDAIPIRRIGRELAGRSKPDSKSGNYYPTLEITQNESGKVWCVTVPSGMIVVRREGFSMLCHNCAEAGALRDSFPTMVGGLYLREEAKANGELEDETPAPSDVKRPAFSGPSPAASLIPEKPAAKPAGASTPSQTPPQGGNAAPASSSAQPEGNKAPPATTQTPSKAPGGRATLVEEPEPRPSEPAKYAESGAQPPETSPPEDHAAEAAAGLAPETPPSEPGDFVPDPKDSEAVNNIKFLSWQAGVTEAQVMAWAKSSDAKLAKPDQKTFAELSTQKLVTLGKGMQADLEGFKKRILEVNKA